MKALVALYRATAREFLRDRMAILFTMLLPLLMAGFFGMIFRQEPAYHANVGIAGDTESAVAKALMAPALAEMVTVETGSESTLLAALKNGKVAAVVVVPPDLNASLAARKPARVAVYWDESRRQDAAPVLTLVRQVLQELNIGLLGGEPLLVPVETALANRRIPTAQLYVPGMLSLALLWLGVFGVAPPLVQMREQQILRRLGATPLRRSTLLGAQVGWRLTTGLLQAALLLAFGMLAYGMRIQGDPLLLLAAVVLGAAVLISLGFLLAGLARSNESVVALGQVIQFPMMFLSGTLFALEMLPAFLRPVAYAMPLTYLADALRQTMLAAPPVFPLWVDFSVLGGCLLLFGSLSVHFFRWE